MHSMLTWACDNIGGGTELFSAPRRREKVQIYYLTLFLNIL